MLLVDKEKKNKPQLGLYLQEWRKTYLTPHTFSTERIPHKQLMGNNYKIFNRIHSHKLKMFILNGKFPIFFLQLIYIIFQSWYNM